MPEGLRVQVYPQTGICAEPERSAWRTRLQKEKIIERGLQDERSCRRGVELFLRPDAAEHDRRYPTLTRLGTGYVVYMPSIGLGVGAETRLMFQAGEVVTNPRDINGYVFVGDGALLRTIANGLTLVARRSPVADAIAEAAIAGSAAYGSRLGALESAQRLVLVSDQGVGPYAMRGDVTPNGVVSIRIAETVSASDLQQARRFALHEIFHFWNNSSSVHASDDAPAWLVEGSAEYASMLVSERLGYATSAESRRLMAARLQGCRDALPPDGDLARLRGSAVYDCGTVIQWLDNLGDGQPEGDAFMSRWRRLIASARQSGQAYGLNDYILAGQEQVSLVTSAGKLDWNLVERRMTAAGIVWRKARLPQSDLATVLQRLIASSCLSTRLHGFERRGSYIALDTDESCGVLRDSPTITSIGGFSVDGTSVDLLEAASTSCQRRGVVEVRTIDGKTLEASCSGAMMPASTYELDFLHPQS